jgi:DnaA family protein
LERAAELSMGEQLLLFRPRSDASFANFFCSAANATTLHALQDWLRQAGGVFYLYGTEGSGRSHLLQAACLEFNFLYLPLADLADQNPQQVLEGLDSVQSICLDDIHTVTNNLRWCEYLFHLFNRCAQAGTKLLISALQPSGQLPCLLPDLRSRLGWGGNFRLQSLDDEACAKALQLRARERGIDLSDDVIAYILARHTRNFTALLQLLERLDKQSLAEKKRITIPFVRRILSTAM